MNGSPSTIRVIIVGAGKGGAALIELFTRSPDVEIAGVADVNPEAPGLRLARNLGIRTATDARGFIAEDRADLIVDVTGDPAMRSLIFQHKPPRAEVMGGTSALLLWKLAQRERDLRNQLIQAEKLASIGTLASGIAHEINNPLYTITGLSEHLHDEARPEVIREYLDEIITAGQRIAGIVRGLNAFARRTQEEEVCEIDLDHTLDEAAKMARRATVFDQVQVVTQYESALFVRGKPDELLQVFVNLITNAVQAMGGCGTLTLSTDDDDGFVQATVQDSGPGIPHNNLTRIFDPFFTTKDQGKGTGLGLHIVRDIVTNYGGQITAESTLGQGATFTVKLPASPH
ncbi:MAG: GHKL domain-containing protein [Nitrospiraceae bacterium]|nr:MAG: GHKL domain-containing protein [Nitrospiraceae bacterium]